MTDFSAPPPPDGGAAPESATDWNRRIDAPLGEPIPTLDSVPYGPDIGTENELRLLGNVEGKRVLEIGCGSGQALVLFAKQGAHAIGVDTSLEHLGVAKRLAEQEKVRVEVHHGDLADLAFMRADSADLVFSAYGMAWVSDLNRVIRQVHRVLREGAPFVFSLPHPAYGMIDDRHPEQPLLVRRPYFSGHMAVDPDNPTVQHHTIADVFTGLTRAKFRVEVLLEPEPHPDRPRTPWWRDTFTLIPTTLVVRARKEGI
jgi:SAM-dependent methyltransferase